MLKSFDFRCVCVCVFIQFSKMHFFKFFFLISTERRLRPEKPSEKPSEPREPREPRELRAPRELREPREPREGPSA